MFRTTLLQRRLCLLPIAWMLCMALGMGLVSGRLIQDVTFDSQSRTGVVLMPAAVSEQILILFDTLLTRAEELQAEEEAEHKQTLSNFSEVVAGLTKSMEVEEANIVRLGASLAETQATIKELKDSIAESRKLAISMREGYGMTKSAYAAKLNYWNEEIMHFRAGITAVDNALKILGLAASSMFMQFFPAIANGTYALRKKHQNAGWVLDSTILSATNTVALSKVKSASLASNGSVVTHTYSSIKDLLSGVRVEFENYLNSVLAEKAAVAASTAENINALEENVKLVEQDIMKLNPLLQDSMASEISFTEELTAARHILEEASLTVVTLHRETNTTTRLYNEVRNARLELISAFKEAKKIIASDALTISEANSSSVSDAEMPPSSNVSDAEVLFEAVPPQHVPLSVFKKHEKRVAGFTNLFNTFKMGLHDQTRDRQSKKFGSYDLTKVKVMISSLISKLEHQALDEATQKSFCDSEMGKIETQKNTSSDSLSEAEAELLKHEGDRGQLLVDIADLEEDIQILTLNREKLESMHTTAKAKAETSKQEAEVSKNLFGIASRIISDAFDKLNSSSSSTQSERQIQDMRTMARVVLNSMEVAIGQYTNIIDSSEDVISTLTDDHEENSMQFAKELVMLQSSLGFKQKELTIANANIPSLEAGINASTVAIQAAETSYEALKGPCVYGEDTYEERVKIRNAEIASLNEALTRVEEMQSELSTSFLSSSSKHVQVGVVYGDEFSSVNNVNNKSDTTNVIEMLDELHLEVVEAQKADVKVYNETKAWCDETIPALKEALTTMRERLSDLRVQAETSIGSKTTLSIELDLRNKEITKETKTQKEAISIYNQGKEASANEKKQLLLIVDKLKRTIIVLESRQQKVVTSDYAAERAGLEDFKDKQSRSLTLNGTSNLSESGAAVIEEKARVTRSLRGAEYRNDAATELRDLALSLSVFLKATQFSHRSTAVAIARSAKGTAVIEALSQEPQKFLFGKGVHAVLVSQTVGGVTVNTVIQILRQLYESFEQDLADLQSSETQHENENDSMFSTKAEQITLLTQATESLTAQLAEASKQYAEAAEGLAQIQKARDKTNELLMTTQSDCSAITHEFETRKSARAEEIYWLGQALVVLKESITTPHGSDANTTSKASNMSTNESRNSSTETVLMHNHHTRRIFVRHSRPDLELKVALTATTQPASSSRHLVKSEAVRNAGYITSALTYLKAPLARRPRLSIRASHSKEQSLDSSDAWRTVATPPMNVTSKLSMARKNKLPTRMLMALAMRARTTREPTADAITAEAINTVVGHIDTFLIQLKKDRAAQLTEKDNCVSELHTATLERERTEVKETKYRTAATTAETAVAGTSKKIEEIEKEISELEIQEETVQRQYTQEMDDIVDELTRGREKLAQVKKAEIILSNIYKASLLQRDLNLSHVNVSRKPSGFTKVYKRSVKGKGIAYIISMIEMKLQSEIEVLEADVKARTAGMDRQLKSLSAAAEEQKLVLATSKRTLGEQSVGNVEAETLLSSAEEAASTATKHLLRVEAECTDLIGEFAVRQEAITQDIDSMSEAKYALLMKIG